MSKDLPIPYNLLTPGQRQMVDMYIDFQLIAINPDSREKLAEFKAGARDSICTQEGIRRLEEMVQNKISPFDSPLFGMQRKPAMPRAKNGFSWSGLKRKLGLK